MNKRLYTWQPDLPDHRDHAFKATKVTLPQRVDLREHCPPVFDQGQLGSCTANALSAAIAFLHRDLIGSRLFIYYNERSIEGTVRQDSGAQIRDGVKSLAKQGVCHESSWPYEIEHFRKKPPTRCYSEAKPHAIGEYMRLSLLQDMLQCLAAGFPFVFGFTVYSAFESDEVAQTGVLHLPQHGETVLGGHAVMAVGYDQPSKRLIVRNSWGADWGDRGYFTMPFEYVTHRGLSDDFWTIRK